MKASKSASHLDIATITLLPYVGRPRYAQAMLEAAKALEKDFGQARISLSWTIYYLSGAM